MNPKQISFPVALAIALALGTLASGCAPDTQPAPSAGDVPAGHAEARGHAETDLDAHDAEPHDAEHAHAEATGVDFPVPADHIPWAPDAPLLEGMSRVRTAIVALDAAPDEATVIARATDVDSAVEYMFANCSLPTEPDIALHAILARLMAGTRDLHANPGDLAPVADMHGAVENYEALFDVPKG